MTDLTDVERSGVVALLARRLAELAPIETTDDATLVGRWTVSEVGNVDPRAAGYVRVTPTFGSRGDDVVEVWVSHQTDEPAR